MSSPSIVKFTTPPQAKDSSEAALEQIQILKKDLEFILITLEKRIKKLEK